MNIAPWLLLALLSVPVLEIFLVVQMIGVLGFLPTLALLIGSASLGMHLLRTQRFNTWMRVQAALARGELPARDMVESAIIAAGGVLLLVPGFLTDLLALPCLIPAARRRLADYILSQAQTLGPRDGGGGRDEPKVIEGEFRRED